MGQVHDINVIKTAREQRNAERFIAELQDRGRPYPTLNLAGKQVKFSVLASAKLDGTKGELNVLVFDVSNEAGESIAAILMSKEQLDAFIEECTSTFNALVPGSYPTPSEK